MKHPFVIYLLLAVLALGAGCKESTYADRKGLQRNKVHDTYTLWADENLKPLLDAALAPYHNEVPEYPVEIRYGKESELVQMYLADSTRKIIICRELTAAEQAQLKQRYQSTGSSRAFATGAVALVTHKANPEQEFQLSLLQQILAGQTVNWPQGGQALTPVCDGARSSNLLTLFRQFNLPITAVPGLFSTGSDVQTLEYVAKTPAALGIIAFEKLSDRKDPKVLELLEQVNVISLNAPTLPSPQNLGSRDAVQVLADGNYPLARTWYVLSRDTKKAIGTAFETYLLSERGQLLVYKTGLFPQTPPSRNVELVEEPAPVVE